MVTQKSVNLYVQVVEISDAYLGPAAERFISRQIQNHLHKEPAELSHKDLLKLIDWVKMAVALLTEDSKLIEEYIDRLTALAREQSKVGKHE